MQKQKTMRYQTSDYLDFDTATALVRKLYREEKTAQDHQDQRPVQAAHSGLL